MAIYFFSQQMWLLLAAMIFLHGTLCAFLSNACHELCHGTVFRTTVLNRLFLYIFSFIRWFPPEYYWQYHKAHHQYTLHTGIDRDPDIFPETENPETRSTATLRNFFLEQFCNPLLMLRLLRRNFRQATGHLANEYEQRLFNTRSRKKVFNWARILLAGHGALTVICLYHGLWILPVLVTLTPCYGGWLQYICNFTQHAGLPSNVNDFRLNCRTLYLNPVIEFFYWHMNYHIEHHMFAAVPCYNLPHLHKALRETMPEPSPGLAATWQQIIAIQYRQKTRPDYADYQSFPDSVGNGTIQDRMAAPGLRQSPLPDAGPCSQDNAPIVPDLVAFHAWQCTVCGFTYSEREGLPAEGIPAGTRWEDIPEDWACPDCGVSKAQFVMQMID